MQISGVNNPLEAAKWGKTPLIQKKATSAVQNAMTNDFVEKLQEQARKDAKRGVGMSEEAIQLEHSQMAKHVSPDRSGPMAQMSQELQKAAQEHKEQQQDPTLEFFDRMLEQLKKSRNTVSTGLSAGWRAVALGIFAVPRRIKLLRYIRRMESKSQRIIQAAAVGRC